MIRLRRTGAKKDPHYRVVVADRAAGRDGAFLEILGHYHPRQQPAEVFFNMERTETWLAQGARMSDTVRSLYRRAKRGSVEEVSEAPPAAPSDAELEAAAEVEAADVSADAEGDPVAQQAAEEADAEPAADADAAEGEVEGDASADEEAEEKSNEV